VPAKAMGVARGVAMAELSGSRRRTRTGIPITSATERAAICSAVAATMMSQPREAAATASNWVATEASAS